MGTIDRTGGTPVYRQIADSLRHKIRSGEYGPGQQLPSERELVEAYRASRVTVRQAIAVLRTEGLIEAHHGRGLFVRNRPRIRRLSKGRLSRSERVQGAGTFTTDARSAPFAPRVEVDLRVEEADERVAELLEIPPGSAVFVRERRMFADDIPVQLATSRLPRTLTEGTPIEQEDTGPGGIYARLEDNGHVLGSFTEQITARMPTPEEAVALQLGMGSPVIDALRIARDQHAHPVEINDILFAADRWELVYELPAD